MKPKKSLKEKVQAEYKDFALEVDRLNSDDLNSRLATLAKELERSETHKEQNDALQAAREAVQELAGPYKDTAKAIRLKTRYIIALLNEKGAV